MKLHSFLFGILASLTTSQMAQAIDWYWDADGATSANTGGAGNWTIGGILWRNGSSTGNLTAYDDLAGPNVDPAANLIFAGADTATVTMSAATVYNLNKITANNTYTFSGATSVANFVGTSPTVEVASGKQLAWGNDLSAASSTITKTGAGTWQFNTTSGQITSANTTIDIQAGTFQYNTTQATTSLATGAGAVVKANAGTLLSLVQTNNNAYVPVRDWTVGSKIILNGGTLNGGSTNGGQFQRIPAATAIQVDASSTIAQSQGNFSQNLTIDGAVTGTGNLALNRAAGAARWFNMKGSMAGYSGNVTIGATTATGYNIFGNSTGWGSGTLTLSGVGSRLQLGDEAATAYIPQWTGGSALGFTAGTLSPAGSITLNAGSELMLYNNTATSAIVLSPLAGMNINGGTLSLNGTAGTSSYLPAASTLWAFGGTAASTVSGKVRLENPGVTFQVADAVAGSSVDATISGILDGTQGFTKTGPGTLRLSAVSPVTNTGTIAVNAGTLSVTGDTGGAAVTVADGAGLSGEGVIGGSLTLGNLTGGVLEVNTATETTALKVKGNLALNGVSTVNFVAGGGLTGIKVLDYDGSLTGSGANLTLANAANYRAGSGVFSTSVPGTITVDIVGANLAWKGSVDNKWDLQTTANWVNDSNLPDTFFQADTVIFDDAAITDQAISLVSNVSPSLMLAASSINYSITNSGGSITGAGKLLKDGTGIFLLNSANTFSGGTTIIEGQVQAGNPTALGTGPVKVGESSAVNGNPSLYLNTARSYVANPITISNENVGGTVTLGSKNFGAGTGDTLGFTNIVLQRDLYIDSNAADRTDYKNISGTGNITVYGTNRTMFSTANTFVGNLTIATTGTAAWLQPFAANALPDTTTITVNAGANLKFGASDGFNALNGSGDISLNTGGTNITYPITVGLSNGSGTFSGTIKNNGTQLFALVKAGTGTQAISGVANTHTGPTTLTGGVLEVTKLANGGLPSSIGQSTNVAASLIFNGGTLAYKGEEDTTDRSFQIGTANTTTPVVATILNDGIGPLGFVGNTGTIGFSTFTGPRTVRLGGSLTDIPSTFGLVLPDNPNGGAVSSLEKVGPSTWILPFGVTQTYTGATTVSAGSLFVNGVLGNSTTTVVANATLAGTGTIGGVLNVSDGATLAPGDSIGTLTAATANMGGVLKIQYDGATPSGTDKLAVTGTLTITGLLDFDAAGAPLTANSYIIATYGTLVGTFGTEDDVPPGYVVNYAFEGNQIALVKTGASPYDTWIASFPSLTDPADKTKAADPDKDGLNNLAEFALDGDPTSAAASGKVAGSVATIGAEEVFVYTIPVRTGSILDPADIAGGPLSLTGDALNYTLQGSTDLTTWTLDISEVVPAQTATLPAVNTGWEYRSFRVPGAVTGSAKDFMRTVITDSP